MLPLFGVLVEREERLVRVHGPAHLHGAEVSVPGDSSAAAFLLAAASLVPRSEVIVRNVGVNPTRTAFLEWLVRSGAQIERLDAREVSREPVADLRILASELKPAPVDESEIPGLIDELPLVAVVAAFGRGTLEIRGARELRVKESDRIAAMAEGLAAIGADVTAHEDGWTIRGKGALRGGTVQAHGDHRIAMAFLVAGLCAKDGVRVEGADAAAVSDPGFLARLRALAR
jgi:3-phosphoshikimate 1-carboxyvinyltransferase